MCEGRDDVMKALLDTNVWLDWLVFDDPGVVSIARAVESGALLALGSEDTRAEWLDVIARPQFDLDRRALAEAVAAYDRFAQCRPRAPACALACRDRDDQKFVDLAVAERANWLITKDRALLALARRAARDWRLSIVRPDAEPLRAALSTAAANL